MPSIRLCLPAFVFAIMFIVHAAAAGTPVFQTDGAAIRGYDPVAYFSEGKPLPGSAQHTVRWNSADWHFANAVNKSKFEADPETYAPQFGGYCAYAVSYGSTAPIDPNAWKIVDGKLYLNYSSGVQDKWSKDLPGNIAKARDNWPQIKSGLTD